MAQAGTAVIVSSNFAFDKNTLADTEGDRRLGMELIHSQYQNARLEKVMELPYVDQIRHFQFNKILGIKVSHYLKKGKAKVGSYKRRSNDGATIEGRIED